MPHRRLQRIGPLVGLPDIVRSHGVSMDAIVEGSGIEAEAFSNRDGVAPFVAICRVMDRAVKLTGQRHLGLEIGLAQDHRALGTVGQLVAHAPTLGEAIQDFVRNQHRNSRGAVTFLMPHGEGFHLGYGIYDRYETGADQLYDLAMAVAVNAIRSLAGTRAGPIEVLVCHRGNAPRSHYEAALGCPVRLNQPYAALALSAEAMRLPIAGHDRAERARLAALLDESPPFGAPDFDARVRHLLKPAILMGDASAETIARQIGIHLRTLNRRLKDEGVTFRAIEQQVRFSIACELLSLTDLDVADISETLAYGTPSAFDRAFRRWTGISPTRWRRGSASGEPR
ncbi:AraC family transcriptional regulator ligand-binding domain-containing protein [Kaistia geumhonensis]|uniref:AraC-like DNA-binding protein n=1 Tax=Kaistia geumhonensis TaxID=410839 RepID=A0ABU0M6E8_9HYPH|nr:AraC family transcriptional regulator [Kaistia geumhonensis]MCX5478247.1 AraC family transcriptional regulator ligand-binding domain-containing protein [Kaistia geumhonensis]MDQ0516536.1 AraC-like DNA-binding protein [Kaistia geumhonensis]